MHKDTVLLTAFCTPTGLYEWLVMPEGSSASRGWFVKVTTEAINDLEQVAAYLGDVIVFDSDPTAHVKTIRALFERLRKHNLKVCPRRIDWAPRMLIFWATPFRPRVSVRTRKKRQH